MAKGETIAKSIANTVERSADDWVRYAGKEGAKYAERVGTETAASVISGMAINGSKADVLRQMRNLNKQMAGDAAQAASQTMLSTAADGQMYFGAFDKEMMAAEHASAKAAKAPREAKVSGRSEVYGQMTFIDKNGNFTGGPGSRARNASPEAPAPSLQERLEAYKAGKREAKKQASEQTPKETAYLRYKLEKEDMRIAAQNKEMEELRQASSHKGNYRTKEEWEAYQKANNKSGPPGKSRRLGDTEYTASDVYQRFNEHAQSWGYENAKEMAKNVNVHNVDELQRAATPFREKIGMRISALKNTARERIDNPRRFADDFRPEEMPAGATYTYIDNVTNGRSARRILNNNNGQGVNVTGSSKNSYSYGFDNSGGGNRGGGNDIEKIAKDNAETAALDNSGIVDWMKENQALAAGILISGGLVAHGLLDDDD